MTSAKVRLKTLMRNEKAKSLSGIFQLKRHNLYNVLSYLLFWFAIQKSGINYMLLSPSKL